MSDVEQISKLFRQASPFLTALGNPDRQKLILLMIDGAPRSVAELTAKTDLSRPTVSHHLKILKDAQIISEQKVGRKIYYQPQPGQHFYTLKQLVNTIDELIKHKGINK